MLQHAVPFGKMEATAIATLAFIFAATALTVLITLCYKGGNGDDSHHQKRHHNKTVASSRGQTNRDIETGDGVDPDIGKNFAVAAVAASTVMYGSGGEGGGDGGGGGGGGGEGGGS
ncbi:hypothetical protein L1987_02254 [Smallanthus sonchifolius]|uniref:Uncharacterized protein n=1 Tax=Smallanthus sonchifolius TaxID=185202 RepID=A0ACB9K7A5_9ASTR|nr:hypothetical protein L1987_02254 [Smallanthus sonchifolius]